MIARYAQRLKVVLRRNGRFGDDAEDLIQEAFLRLEAYRRHHEVREPEAFLVRTVANLSVDKHRHDSVLEIVDQDVEQLAIYDTAPRPDEVCAARERLNKLIAGLDTLSPKTKEIFVGLRLEGLSYREIAERHDITVSAVEKHIARAMLFLTEWMDDGG